MNKFWLLACLTCLGFSGCCSEMLQNLCEADRFNYSGIWVNSVYLATKVTKLKTVGEYAIDPYETCEENTDEYREVKNSILNIKKKYNQLMVRIYSERFLNDAQLDEAKLDAENDQISKWIDELQKLKLRGDISSCIDEKFIGQMRKISPFFEELKPYFKHRLPGSDDQFIYDQVWFQSLLEDIKYMRSSVGYTMAFVKEFDTDVFRKPIKTRPKFEFVPYSKIIYDFKSYLIRRFKIAYPFNNPALDDSKPCLKAADLSPFYSDKEAREEKY